MLSMNSSSALIIGEFPHWKVTTSIFMIIKLLLMAPASLFVSLSIVVTIFKTKSLRKPINLIHQSLLILNSLIILSDTITSFIFVPPLLRACECSQTTSIIIFVTELLYVVFQPLNYACLSIFQLLIIKGKRRFVSYKAVCTSILICAGITTMILIEGVTLVVIAEQRYICTGICPRINLSMTQKFPGITITFISYVITSWFPSLLVVVVSTTWSCVIFKKNIITSSDELNRRIISLPVVLPITLVVPSMLSFTLLLSLEHVLTSLALDNLPYWILFQRLLIFDAHELISGIGYPCLLLYLNPQIRKYWKIFIIPRRCVRRSTNQILPTNK